MWDCRKTAYWDGRAGDAWAWTRETVCKSACHFPSGAEPVSKLSEKIYERSAGNKDLQSVSAEKRASFCGRRDTKARVTGALPVYWYCGCNRGCAFVRELCGGDFYAVWYSDFYWSKEKYTVSSDDWTFACGVGNGDVRLFLWECDAVF